MSHRSKLKTVHLTCGHHIFVPSYQTADPAAYTDHECQKCTTPEAERTRGWKKGRESK